MNYMIAYITSFLSIITCLLAWFLGIFNKLSDLKLQERRKLNLLIYNLLELHFWVQKEVLLDARLNQLLNDFQKHFQSLENDKDTESAYKSVLKALKNNFRGGIEIPALEGTIDELVKELAEVDPFFAFELNGKYQIAAQLKKNCMLVANLSGKEPQHTDIQEVMDDLLHHPQMLRELQADLKIKLPLIARRAGRRFYRQYQKLAVPISIEIDAQRVAEFLDKVVQQLEMAPE